MAVYYTSPQSLIITSSYLLGTIIFVIVFNHLSMSYAEYDDNCIQGHFYKKKILLDNYQELGIIENNIFIKN